MAHNDIVTSINLSGTSKHLIQLLYPHKNLISNIIDGPVRSLVKCFFTLTMNRQVPDSYLVSFGKFMILFEVTRI